MPNQQNLLSGYNDQEKTAYLHLVASIATADRVASEQEIEFLEALADNAELAHGGKELVVASAKNPSLLDVPGALNVLKNSDLRYVLMADLIAFAKSDGVLSTEEQGKLGLLAQSLHVQPTQMQAVDDLVSTVEHNSLSGTPVDESSLMNKFGIGDKLSKVGISPGIARTILTILAPMVLSRVLGGKRGGNSGMASGVLGGLLGNMGGGSSSTSRSGGIGGLLGSILGGTLGGGTSTTAQPAPTQSGGGGLGSLINILGGGKGYGDIRGILGKILSGSGSSTSGRSGGGFPF